MKIKARCWPQNARDIIIYQLNMKTNFSIFQLMIFYPGTHILKLIFKIENTYLSFEVNFHLHTQSKKKKKKKESMPSFDAKDILCFVYSKS